MYVYVLFYYLILIIIYSCCYYHYYHYYIIGGYNGFEMRLLINLHKNLHRKINNKVLILRYEMTPNMVNHAISDKKISN